jgi:tetratricopeptide (TPR) repeat protein
MAWFLKTKWSAFAAAVALIIAGVSAGPGWAQQNCSQPKGREVQPPGLPSSLMLVNIAKAAKPADLMSHRPALLTANSECARKDNLEKFGKNIDLQACVAESARLLASLDRSFAQFEQADCAYTNVIRLSKNADTTASAWEGKAQNFHTWGQPARAVDAWREAARSPTPQRIRALARTLGAVGTPAAAAEADTWYGRLGLLQQTGYSAEDQTVLREWAMLRNGVLQNPQGAIDVWSRLDTAEAHSEVGRFHFNANRTDQARREFIRVIELKNDEGAAARVAEASYLLGVMTAREARNSLAWNQAFKFARDAGSSDPRHGRLTCLALIASGEKAVLSSTSEFDACRVGLSATAEDYLVRGAYLLRRMQFLPTCDSKTAAERRAACNTQYRNDFISLANEANSAFSEGQRRPPLTAGVTPPPTFNWLMESDAPSLSDLLRAGTELSNSVTQANAGCGNLRKPAAASPEDNFFARLDLLSCGYTRFF